MVVMINLAASEETYTNILDITMGIRGAPLDDPMERQFIFPDIYEKDGVEYVTCSDEVHPAHKIIYEKWLKKFREDGSEEDEDNKFFMFFENIPDGVALESAKKNFYRKNGYKYKGRRTKKNPPKGKKNYEFNNRNGSL